MPSRTASLIFFLLLLSQFFVTAPKTQSANNDQPIKVLFLGDNGHHQPASRFRELAPVLQRRGIDLVYADDVAVLNPTTLNKHDALVLYANIDSIAPEQAEALLDYVAGGGGFVPLHCASYCFRNSPEVVQLIGAQFRRHGTGVFRTSIVAADHEVMQGFQGFESWDETYVHHLHYTADRTVLEVRVDEQGDEPWTWVRSHGRGRVFYTAWGHDQRTWTNPGFHNLVERGIRYVTGQQPHAAGPFVLDRPFEIPAIKSLPDSVGQFSYVEVGREIPNYLPSEKWGTQGEPQTQMQLPLDPGDALKHIVTPKGFHVELFAAEPDLQGKPIGMAWDERGRLWVAETYDYPNELQPAGQGRDRIRICEDSDGDGRADRFSVFAQNLSIPTTLAFYRGGVIVQDGDETVFLKDIDGDGQADQRTVLVTGWSMRDTHGGVSNFQWGLDNWVWGMQGYNASSPVALGQPQQPFRMGFFRMRPDGSEVEFIRSTNNNTWGLGFSEEGLVFGSTANGNPSVFMPIPNRYYERVKSWTPSLVLGSIADSNRFLPITPNVRQVDHHGGYTAAAGHALYTARQYPEAYWNRVAFVAEPTGHLVASFIIKPRGSSFHSTNPFNLFASDDQWSSPIMAEVGPDGNVWVIDWYNYIIQHNPTPQGFKTGKGAAYETKLRDKKYGRIYRVVHDSATPITCPDLSRASPAELVAALSNPVMLTRKHAQRLLVERGATDVVAQLISLINDQSMDSIGLNPAAIHALWTLHGLGQMDGKNLQASQAAISALQHTSAGVRRNALQVLPPTIDSTTAVLLAGVLLDSNPNVRLQALLALADLPVTESTGAAIAAALVDPVNANDTNMAEAATSAAASSAADFLVAVSQADNLSAEARQVMRIVAGHYARSEDHSNIDSIMAALISANSVAVDAIMLGLEANWDADKSVTMTPSLDDSLDRLVRIASPESSSSIVKLATRWGSQRLAQHSQEIAASLLKTVLSEQAEDQARIKAAHRAVDFQADSDLLVDSLLAAISPRTTPEVARGILSALRASRAPALGEKVLRELNSLSPTVKREALTMLLARPALTHQLLEAVQQGNASLNDLALDQKQSLAAHPDHVIREQAQELLKMGGSLPNADRQQVVKELSHVTKALGDVAKGQEVFKQQCSKCHLHGGEGVNIGPDLTGMAVHPKDELLVHILDPSRSVENNFRAYTVLTVDGVVLTGMLASESKTAIELFDTEGKKQAVLREEIEQLTASPKSIMPEGFEKTLSPQQLTDLLQFLTARGKYLPLDIARVATSATDRGMFDQAEGPPTMEFDDWSTKSFKGVPFHFVTPRDGNVLNAIQLYGPRADLARKMPRSVTLPCGGPVKQLHLLGGIAGWGHPYGRNESTSVIVRFTYENGQTEEHQLLNGVHIADYIRRVDVPKSEFAFDMRGKQLRYLTVTPQRGDPIRAIDLVKGDDDTCPIILALTIETN